ncbi:MULTISPECIES: response regulator [Achromobacter]|nr:MULTISPECIES: response regulator [Achromobacter]MBC9908702.1 response regulator [Achromobacter xylosoxidans]MBD0872756.1 response regulator [Achromobacter xylosoxidans]QNP87953.1 response regulator [Achromobacter xylosoxidans]
MSNMKTHASEWVGLQNGTRFLFCSQGNAVAAQLGQALGDLGMLTQEAPRIEELARRLTEIAPQVVFLDFTLSDDEPGKLFKSAELARLLARIAPTLPRVAVGFLSQPEGAIAALRAGVSDFVDPSVAPQEIKEVVLRLLDRPSDGRMDGTRRSVVLLGARPGVGTSTLAVHMAGMVQDRLKFAHGQRAATSGAKTPKPAGEPLPLSSRVALMDLGWPIGDCQLYLNIGGDFDFAEAARNLRRLDSTLLGSAMAHTANGLSVLSLPRDLGQMRDVSQSDSLLVFERMRQHFSVVVADAGGFSNPEFVSGLARASQLNWIVTDQSVGALVSLAGVLQELEQQHVDRRSLGLIVNRYDERYGMTAQQIAERFQLELVGTLPDRTLPLMVCTNRGHLLHEEAERDVYVRAVQALAERLCAEENAPGGRAGWLATWLPGVHRRMVVG